MTITWPLSVRDDRVDQVRSGGTITAAEEQWPLTDVRLLAPIPQPPAIFGIGYNYRAHAQETGDEPPEAPIVFMKTPFSSGPTRRAGQDPRRRAAPRLRG